VSGPEFGRGASQGVESDSPSKGDCLLEVLELAMNRDPDQEFELLLVLERERGDLEAPANNNNH
jgi:hypothetical protein